MNAHTIYVHLPFCKSRCIYCDFTSNVVSPLPVHEVTQQVVSELQIRRQVLQIMSQPVAIYVGGGTPSLWPADKVAQIIAECVNGESPSAIEITVELNPGDVDRHWIKSVIKAGVNRFSLGVQGMTDSRLKWLGRRHSVADAQRAVHVLRDAGAHNISADFIYATPNQTEADMRHELDDLCAMGPDHISAYELTIAEGTPLAKMKLPGIDHDTRASLWQQVGAHLAQQGFERYEVSNYAKDNKRSRHNSHYWRGGMYLGVGSGAHGFIINNGNRIRYSNGATLQTWLAADIRTDDIEHNPFIGDGFAETLSNLDFARELVMLGLRSTEGINASQLNSLLKDNYTFMGQITQLENEGWVQLQNNRYVPSPDAMQLADELALRFF
ncbi:MAG: radical SAM family heme chaperone HemW [Deltaproteobacteria bacterium]|nr:radical SAM family heme chaperone HemW [Deltaproteobacteria bacterium]